MAWVKGAIYHSGKRYMLGILYPEKMFYCGDDRWSYDSDNAKLYSEKEVRQKLKEFDISNDVRVIQVSIDFVF